MKLLLTPSQAAAVMPHLRHGMTLLGKIERAGFDGSNPQVSGRLTLELGSVPTGSMFERYQSWAGRNGLRYPLTLRTLTKRLRERGLRCTRTHGQRHWQGVALK